MTMTYHVHSIEQDLAGKWYARVVITPEQSEFLKFDHLPTMAEIQDAAIAFVAANYPELLRPVPESAGQEWTAPDGSLWRVAQSRDSNSGQFIADDPLTPVRESLVWVEVSDAAAE
jgi:hypothetical protein